MANEQAFQKSNIQMAYKVIKKCSVSLLIRELQMKATIGCH